MAQFVAPLRGGVRRPPRLQVGAHRRVQVAAVGIAAQQARGYRGDQRLIFKADRRRAVVGHIRGQYHKTQMRQFRAADKGSAA